MWSLGTILALSAVSFAETDLRVVAHTDQFTDYSNYRFDNVGIAESGDVFFIARTGEFNPGGHTPKDERAYRWSAGGLTLLLQQGDLLEGQKLPIKRVLALNVGRDGQPFTRIKLKGRAHYGKMNYLRWADDRWHVETDLLKLRARLIRKAHAEPIILSADAVSGEPVCVGMGTLDVGEADRLCVGEDLDFGGPQAQVGMPLDGAATGSGSGVVVVALRGPGIRSAAPAKAVLAVDSGTVRPIAATIDGFVPSDRLLAQIGDVGTGGGLTAICGSNRAGTWGVLLIRGEDATFVDFKEGMSHKPGQSLLVVTPGGRAFLTTQEGGWSIDESGARCLVGVGGRWLDLRDGGRRALLEVPQVGPDGSIVCHVLDGNYEALWLATSEGTVRCLYEGQEVQITDGDVRTIDRIRLSPWHAESEVSPAPILNGSHTVAVTVQFPPAPGYRPITQAVVVVKSSFEAADGSLKE